MDITPLIPAERQVIQAYGGGRFRISGSVFEGSVLVLPDRAQAWPVDRMAALTIDSLDDAIGGAERVELLLIGSGRQPAPLPAGLRDALRVRGVVVEVMDTGAACRTYNVLLSEDRRIAAALIAVD